MITLQEGHIYETGAGAVFTISKLGQDGRMALIFKDGSVLQVNQGKIFADVKIRKIAKYPNWKAAVTSPEFEEFSQPIN